MATRSPAISSAPFGIPQADQPLKLVWTGSDEASAANFVARLYVAEDGGPIRTIIGDYHQHYVGEEHSAKTQLSNPHDGGTEHALIVESELRSDVLTYRTQAFRLRLMVGTDIREWICDHLRQVRVNGVDVIEAIECKPDMSFLGGPDERAKLAAVKRVIERMGWRFRVVYHRDVVGNGERQINFGHIYAHKTTHVPDDRHAAFERMVESNPVTTFGALSKALDDDPRQGKAMAHAMICSGRVQFDLNRWLTDTSAVRLLPPAEFTPKIWF